MKTNETFWQWIWRKNSIAKRYGKMGPTLILRYFAAADRVLHFWQAVNFRLNLAAVPFPAAAASGYAVAVTRPGTAAVLRMPSRAAAALQARPGLKVPLGPPAMETAALLGVKHFPSPDIALYARQVTLQTLAILHNIAGVQVSFSKASAATSLLTTAASHSPVTCLPVPAIGLQWSASPGHISVVPITTIKTSETTRYVPAMAAQVPSAAVRSSAAAARSFAAPAQSSAAAEQVPVVTGHVPVTTRRVHSSVRHSPAITIHIPAVNPKAPTLMKYKPAAAGRLLSITRQGFFTAGYVMAITRYAPIATMEPLTAARPAERAALQNQAAAEYAPPNVRLLPAAPGFTPIVPHAPVVHAPDLAHNAKAANTLNTHTAAQIIHAPAATVHLQAAAVPMPAKTTQAATLPSNTPDTVVQGVTAPSTVQAVDVSRLAEQVYQVIERKIIREKERRGM